MRQYTQKHQKGEDLYDFDELCSYGQLLMEIIGVALYNHSDYHFMFSEYNGFKSFLHIMLRMFGPASLRRFTRSYANDVDVIVLRICLEIR